MAWLLIPAGGIGGAEPWRVMFALGALPALVCIYLRGAMEESERWLVAVREHRRAATENAEEAPAARAKRPFTLTEVSREPESRKRVLLVTALSFSTTVG